MSTAQIGSVLITRNLQLNSVNPKEHSESGMLRCCILILIRLDSNRCMYGGDFTEHPVLKRGKHWANFSPTVSPMVNYVKPAKKDGVLKLIDEIGVSDQVHRFYMEAFIDVGRQHLEESSDEDDKA